MHWGIGAPPECPDGAVRAIKGTARTQWGIMSGAHMVPSVRGRDDIKCMYALGFGGAPMG